jgi:hypothetical protein
MLVAHRTGVKGAFRVPRWSIDKFLGSSQSIRMEATAELAGYREFMESRK